MNTNLLNNRINQRLTDAEFATIKQAIKDLRNLMPFLTGLTLEERKRLAKMYKANRLFVEDAVEVARDNPEILPAYISAEELENDYVLFQQLDEILFPLAQLTEKVRDTQMLAGSEGYQTGLALYRLTKIAAGAGMPGIDTAYDKLRARFDGQGNFGENEDDDETDDTNKKDNTDDTDNTNNSDQDPKDNA